jgi:hypothetical protein
MSIYSQGNTKEYLANIIAVLRIIKQKGLDAHCRNLGNAVVKLTGMFKDLMKAAGSTCRTMTWRPASWRSRSPRRCSKKPRSSTTRQLPRCTSY